jgi:hypothetical protein
MSDDKNGGSRLAGFLATWWNGTSRPVEHHPGITFINLHPKRHWTSTAAHNVVDFIAHEWKWAIGTCVAIAGLIIAAMKL